MLLRSQRSQSSTVLFQDFLQFISLSLGQDQPLCGVGILMRRPPPAHQRPMVLPGEELMCTTRQTAKGFQAGTLEIFLTWRLRCSALEPGVHAEAFKDTTGPATALLRRPEGGSWCRLIALGNFCWFRWQSLYSRVLLAGEPEAPKRVHVRARKGVARRVHSHCRDMCST